jgi:adenosine deaminase
MPNNIARKVMRNSDLESDLEMVGFSTEEIDDMYQNWSSVDIQEELFQAILQCDDKEDWVGQLSEESVMVLFERAIG